MHDSLYIETQWVANFAPEILTKTTDNMKTSILTAIMFLAMTFAAHAQNITVHGTVLNAYFALEQNSEYEGTHYGQYYRDAHYTPGKNEFYPIPYNQLYYVPDLYVQNRGYN